MDTMRRPLQFVRNSNLLRSAGSHLLASLTLLVVAPVFVDGRDTWEAEAIIRETGIEGGLVVHVGCGDGELSVDLSVEGSYLVHGLDTASRQVVVSTRDSLYVAGPKDIMDEKDYYFPNATEGYEQNKSDLESQSDIWNGEDGAVLLAVNKSDGTPIAEYRLDAISVFDGMIAAEDRVLVSLESGRLICLGGDRTEEK